MNNENNEVLVDFEEMVDYISNKLAENEIAVSEEVIIAVLEAETEFLDELGLID